MRKLRRRCAKDALTITSLRKLQVSKIQIAFAVWPRQRRNCAVSAAISTICASFSFECRETHSPYGSNITMSRQDSSPHQEFNRKWRANLDNLPVLIPRIPAPQKCHIGAIPIRDLSISVMRMYVNSRSPAGNLKYSGPAGSVMLSASVSARWIILSFPLSNARTTTADVDHCSRNVSIPLPPSF